MIAALDRAWAAFCPGRPSAAKMLALLGIVAGASVAAALMVAVMALEPVCAPHSASEALSAPIVHQTPGERAGGALRATLGKADDRG